jgi:hypothetical protein
LAIDGEILEPQGQQQHHQRNIATAMKQSMGTVYSNDTNAAGCSDQQMQLMVVWL